MSLFGHSFSVPSSALELEGGAPAGGECADLVARFTSTPLFAPSSCLLELISCGTTHVLFNSKMLTIAVDNGLQIMVFK
jgi:hypothetical protein